jgi:hypothetical protein
MTREEMAAMLNGRQYMNEILAHESAKARDAGLLVIYGASDDLIELCGAIENDSEFDAFGGTSFRLASDGRIAPEVEPDDEDYLEKYGLLEAARKRFESAIKIKCESDANGYSWFIDTDIPFSPFDILEGAEKYCRGIVIDMRDVKGN